MYVLVTYKLKIDRINSNREKVETYMYNFRRSRAANTVVSRQIWPKFDLIQAFMTVLITCKNQNDRNINSRKKVETSFFHYKSMGYFRRSRADNFVVGGPIWSKDSNSLVILCISSLPTNLIWIGSIATNKKCWRRFFRRSRAINSVGSRQMWPKFVLILACVHVLITCMYEKDQMKNNR